MWKGKAMVCLGRNEYYIMLVADNMKFFLKYDIEEDESFIRGTIPLNQTTKVWKSGGQNQHISLEEKERIQKAKKFWLGSKDEILKGKYVDKNKMLYKIFLEQKQYTK